MKFYNHTPIGEQDPRLRSNDAIIYHTSITVKVYDQDDLIGGNDWRFGDLGVPRWEHAFTSKDSAVYKPAEGDSRRYKARVEAKWSERERTSETTWGPEKRGESLAFVERLKDGGQAIAIEPYFGAPRDIVVSSSVDGPEPSLFAGGGVLYRVNGAGDLARYAHDQSGVFVNYDGAVIGWGWAGFKWICAVRDGGLYGVLADGTLRYYHHNGDGAWDDVNGRDIGSGWAGFAWVGAGRFGQLYAITSAGDLLLYEHDGGFAWTTAAHKLGSGWPKDKVFTGGTNCLYLIDSAGDLRYYYHDDARAWVHQDKKLDGGWGSFQAAASSGNGELYAILANGDLVFYRHDVDRNFISGSGRTIGWGWGSQGPHSLLPSAR